MKELSIEEKAELYDKAIERARALNNGEDVDVEAGTTTCEYIFPELKESEDERIRRDILELVRQSSAILDKQNQNSMIAWLEKQGKHAENNEDDADIDFTVYHPLKNGKGIYECIPYSFYGTLSSFDEDKDMIDFLHLCFYTEEECNEWIKQNKSTDTCDSLIIKSKEFPASEKRDFGYFSEPADKVEPKFHEDDWVVFANGNVERIISVGTHGYTFDDGDYLLHENCDKNAHLWTIQDAKDGDLLDANGAPFIYKKHDKDYVYFYCGVNLAGCFVEANGIDTWNNNNKVYPATKEQRDTLEKAMRNAGWEFDFGKKELKEIEQKPAEWSEEDEYRAKNAIYFLDTAKKHYASTVELDACIDWLKSLKQRIGE